MFIDKKLWEKLKENIDNLYWDEDRMSTDGRYFLKQLDINVKEIENKTKSEVYIISTNSIVDDEISNEVNSVTLSFKEAQEIFKKLVNNLKTSMDYDLLDIVNIDDVDISDYEGWVVDSSEDYFSLFYNGDYNSNNINIHINKFDLVKDRHIEVESENMEVN